MLLLTNCEVHTGKYLDRSSEIRIELSVFTHHIYGSRHLFVVGNLKIDLRVISNIWKVTAK